VNFYSGVFLASGIAKSFEAHEHRALIGFSSAPHCLQSWKGVSREKDSIVTAKR
jgi:hypothetical protein